MTSICRSECACCRWRELVGQWLAKSTGPWASDFSNLLAPWASGPICLMSRPALHDVWSLMCEHCRTWQSNHNIVPATMTHFGFDIHCSCMWRSHGKQLAMFRGTIQGDTLIGLSCNQANASNTSKIDIWISVDPASFDRINCVLVGCCFKWEHPSVVLFDLYCMPNCTGSHCCNKWDSTVAFWATTPHVNRQLGP